MPGLSNGVKGFCSKTFPTPLTGVSWGRFFKALKCYQKLKEDGKKAKEGKTKQTINLLFPLVSIHL
jgi:hypothetical protein